MSPEESLKVCRMAKALSPAQAVDEYTPEAWSLILRKYRFADAETALEELGAEQEFIHVSHIVKRIKRIRNNRVAAYGTLPAPSYLDPSDTAAYSEWIRTTTAKIADGEIGRDDRPPALVAPASGPIDYGQLMPRPTTHDGVATARRAIHAARETLCTHRLPAESCQLCADAERRTTATARAAVTQAKAAKAAGEVGL